MDTCDGDSGGPVVCPLKDQPDQYSLAGLTSFGSMDCGNKHMAGYYTRVERFIDWIEAQTGEVE